MAVTESELARSPAITRLLVWPRVSYAAAALMLTLFGVEALFFVSHSYLNRDEGWYLLSGQLAYHGALPYRDFPYFQMPLVPYVFGLAALLDPTITSGRLVAAILGGVSVALVFYIGQRIGGVFTATMAALLLLVTPDFMLASTTARAEAVVVPLTLLAAAIALRHPTGLIGFAGPPAVLLIATAARLTFLPAFAVALAYCYWRSRPSRSEAIAGTTAILAVGLIVALPLLLAPPGRALFDVWTAQALRNGQFDPVISGAYAMLSRRTAFLSVPVGTFFVVLVPALFLAVRLGHMWKDGWRPSRIGFGGDPFANDFALLVLAILLWLPFAGFDHQETRYFVPSFALLSIVAADLLARGRRGVLHESMHLLPAVFVILFAGHALFGLAAVGESLDKNDVRETADAGTYIRLLTPPDQQIVTLNPTLALAAGRPLPDSLVMGQFSFWPRFSDARASAAGVVNVARLENEMLDPRTAVIAFDDYDLQLIARFRDEDPLVDPLAPWPYKLFPSLAGQFETARTIDRFGQFAGTLYILRRTT